MGSLKAIIRVSCCCFAVSVADAASAQSINSNTKTKERTENLIPTRRGNPLEFELRQRDGGSVEVTFGGCVQAADAACGNGVGSVDHDEETGSCSFTCLAAP